MITIADKFQATNKAHVLDKFFLQSVSKPGGKNRELAETIETFFSWATCYFNKLKCVSLAKQIFI